MKARDWLRFLEGQRLQHEKLLFSVTELANVSGASRNALNVELTRLRRQGSIVRYAQGIYGLPGAVSPETLLPGIDPHAYITGSYSLHIHNLITQVPARIICFTDRRSPRARIRSTPVGLFEFVCVRSRIYSPPPGAPLASPEQSLCDFVYLSLRHGLRPEGMVTFRNFARIRTPMSSRLLERYPATVQREVEALLVRYNGDP